MDNGCSENGIGNFGSFDEWVGRRGVWKLRGMVGLGFSLGRSFTKALEKLRKDLVMGSAKKKYFISFTA